MKLSILQSKLKEALNIVRNITSKTTALPILNNIFLKTEGNFLSLSATDLEVGIKWWILTKVEKEGEIVVPGKIFSDFISYFPQKAIDLTVEKNILSVNSEGYQTKIKGGDSENFPIIPQSEKGKYITLEGYQFCQGLSQVADFAAPSNSKPEISGICFSLKKNKLFMASTDRVRLSEKTINIKEVPQGLLEKTLIVPQRAAREVVNIFQEKEGDIKVYFEENQVIFERDMEETKHPQVYFVSKLIEGEYPQYSEVIPKRYRTEAVLNKEEFLNHIKAASIFSGRMNEIKIKINPAENIIELFCQNAELGEHRSSLKAKITGEEAEISFNYRFLSEGLLCIKSKEVLFALSDKKGEEGPGVLKPVGDDSFTYIAMPLPSV